MSENLSVKSYVTLPNTAQVMTFIAPSKIARASAGLLLALSLLC